MRDQGMRLRLPGWDRERAREILLSAVGFAIVMIAACGLVVGILAWWHLTAGSRCPTNCYPGGPGSASPATPFPRVTG